MADEEEIELSEGMPVTNEEGQQLGKLSSLLIPEEGEEAEFLIVQAGGKDRLVPFEAVLGVGDGSLILDVPSDAIARYPAIAEGADPTEKDIAAAYDTYEDTAEYEFEEE